jgi:hypothetical protein
MRHCTPDRRTGHTSRTRPIRRSGLVAAISLLVMLATAVACGGTPSWQTEHSTNHPRAHVMIQFTDGSLHPSTAQITANGNVVWINYTNAKQGTVFFESSVRDAFPCDMRPLFMEVAGGWQSIPIKGDSENVILPCTPKPGEYGYELWLYDDLAGVPSAGMDDPETQMLGKIKVVP